MRDLLVITPSRGRPLRLAAMLTATLGNATSRTDVAVAVDDDDDLDAYQEAAQPVEVQWPGRILWRTGPRDTLTGWTNRIAATGIRDYRALASLGDDHVPRTAGWDTMLLDALLAMPGGLGIAYGDDQLQGINLPTAPVISSRIVAELGWMCHPDLEHMFVDNVWRDLGLLANCLVYHPEVIIEHVHPVNGKAQPDATYEGANARLERDGIAYAEYVRSGALAADALKIRGAAALVSR